MFASCFDVVS